MKTRREEYIYSDFLATLDSTGRQIAEAINEHIALCYPEYKPFDIRPENKSANEWMLNFRKRPGVGQAFCTLYSIRGKFLWRIISNDHELHLRKYEFGDKIRPFIMIDFCRKCTPGCNYQWRQYYYFDEKLQATVRPECPSVTKYATMYGGYGLMEGLGGSNIEDILHLIDLKAKYAAKPKDPRNICGSDYAKTNKERCGDVEITALDERNLDIDDFVKADYTDVKKIDRYAASFSLTPMGVSPMGVSLMGVSPMGVSPVGVNGGLWYFCDDAAVCGERCDDYAYTVIPKGRYAFVTVTEPFNFSARRAWNYTAKWIYDNGINIRPAANLTGKSVPCYIKFYRQNGENYMSVYVPVE